MSEEQNKKKKLRSPNYPYIGLEEAVSKTQLLLEHGGLHEIPFNSAMAAWGYKAGTTNSVIAAIKAFGLINVIGEGEKRKVQLTEVARKILKDGHPEKERLIKESALMPSIYQDLWTKFNGNLPPSDSLIDNYLEFDKKFNPEVIKGLIKDFRATVAYAKLNQSDKIESDELNDGLVSPPKNDTSGNGSLIKGDSDGGRFTSPPKLSEGVMYSITIDVLNDGQINIETAGGLNSKTMALLTDVFTLKEKHEVKPSAMQPPPKRQYPCSAMWQNQDHDQPVTVTGELGYQDGKLFYSVRESTTGISENELDFGN
jgi:hypothetical protein